MDAVEFHKLMQAKYARKEWRRLRRRRFLRIWFLCSATLLLLVLTLALAYLQHASRARM